MRYWNIFREMDALQRELDELFHSTGFGRLPGQSYEPGPGRRPQPQLNLREDADNLYVEALIPGIEPQGLEMNVLGNTLSLSGERETGDAGKDGRTWHRRERGTGKFMRTIELPVDVQVDKIKAEAKNGLLRVTLPKAVEAKPRKIDIKLR